MFQVLMFWAFLPTLRTCPRASVGETSQYRGIRATSVSASRASWRCSSVRGAIGIVEFSRSRVESTCGLLYPLRFGPDHRLVAVEIDLVCSRSVQMFSYVRPVTPIPGKVERYSRSVARADGMTCIS